MPLGKNIARFNRRFTNRVALRVAGWLPGFAILSHVGRKSGRTYRTPINAFRRNGRYIVALTYGPDSDWVQNVLAAGSCEVQSKGRYLHLFEPHINTDPRNEWAPLPVRLILNLTHTSQTLQLLQEEQR